MRRIFHIITHFELGGAERVAINICKSHNEHFTYHIVEVVRGKSEFTEQMLNELKENNIKYHRSPISSNKLGIILFPIWFLILYLKYRPTIIHTHTEIPDLSIYLFHFICPWHKRYVRTIHNTELWNNWKFIGKKVESFFISKKANIAISIATKEEYLKAYDESYIPIIYNGIEQVSQKKFPYLQKNKINVLFAGRLEAQKGISEMISVVKSLNKETPYFFHIVGNGTLKQYAKSETQDIPFIKFYEKIYGLSHYLKSFDYLFMPSRHEGLALMSIEASLAHTPTIINSCKGLAETLPSDWELAVHENSIKEYINIFYNKLPNIDYNKVAEKAYKYATSHFDIRIMQQQYEKFYSKL